MLGMQRLRAEIEDASSILQTACANVGAVDSRFGNVARFASRLLGNRAAAPGPPGRDPLAE